MNSGMAGALLGILLGVLGGAIGTFWSIRKTKGPRERAFMMRVAGVTWVVIIAFLAGTLFLPHPFKWLVWGPYVVAMPVGVLWMNRRLKQIRSEEGTEPQPKT